VILAGEGTLEMKHLPAFLQNRPLAAATAPDAPAAEDRDTIRLPIGATVGEAEKELILRTLEHTNNNKTRAAEILGISLKTLHNKLREYKREGRRRSGRIGLAAEPRARGGKPR